MSDSVRPHRRQPMRPRRPWDSPGKNTGVGCHFLLQCMKGKSESEVAQSCPTLNDPMDCSLPGSSVHGIFQARVLEWGAIAFSHQSTTHLICKTKWTCYNHAFRETNSLRRTMQIVECSLLHQWAHSRVSLAKDPDQLLCKPYIPVYCSSPHPQIP